MNDSYDAIVIGGGHNGLTAAAYLARAGRRVLLLEARGLLGGAAATESIWPGFQVDTGAVDAGLFDDEIVRDLFLKMHGLAFRQGPALLCAPQPDGRMLTLWRDEARTVQELAQFSERDAARYPAFASQVNRLAGVLRAMMALSPPDPFAPDGSDLLAWAGVGLKLKGLGDREMMEFLRVLPMPVYDYLDEWFESEALKGALGLAGVTGLMGGPRGGGTALMLLYQHSQGWASGRFVLGGMGTLSAALAGAAQAAGAQIECNAPVSRILVEDNRAVGVVLDNGRVIKAGAVLSSLDARRTLFELAGASLLEPRTTRAVRNILYRGSTARVNLALSAPPAFGGLRQPAELCGRIHISPTLDYLERAYDDAKYGRLSTAPALDIAFPTLADPTLAPPGHHIMTINVRYAPYHLREGDWDEERETLADTIIETLSSYAPGIADLILHRQVLTPLDLERTYGLSEGQIHQGQMGLDQLLIMRPIPGWSNYQTPIDALHLCGAATHPGGGVTGLPGKLAARTVLASV